MTLPTIAQNAPYTWIIIADSNGNYVSSLPVSIQNTATLGQQLSTASYPVVLASDEIVPIQFGGTTQLATGSGLNPANMPAFIPYVSASGGPVDTSGKPQSLGVDIIKTLQGSGIGGSNTNITATVIGDTNLVFSSAPKTLYPGAKVQLTTGSGSSVQETVVVSQSYTPSSSATTIPLAAPVIIGGSTTAKWDIYAPLGPNGTNILPHDIPVVALAIQDGGAGAGNIFLATSAGNDGQSKNKYLEVCTGKYNGTNIDMDRNNTDVIVLASASRTSTQTQADQTNYNARGLIVTLDMTVVAASPSVTLEIDGKDANGIYYSLLTGAAVVTISTNVYTVYPGAPTTANVSANSPLPRTYRIKVVANNANAGTYSVGASLIV